MTPFDPDPLRPQEMDPARVNPYRPALPRFREQRRRSRWGCSVALVALTLACLVFWAAVLFVAVNVVAGDVESSRAPLVGIAVRPVSGTGNLEAAPYLPSAPQPAAASQPASPDVSVPAPLSALTYTGIVNYAEPSLGRYYLAIPNGPGWRVRICGPAGCLDRTSTDAGPDLAMQRAGRIADLNSVDWQQISGVSLRFGGFQGTVLVVGRPRTSLPETSTEEGR